MICEFCVFGKLICLEALTPDSKIRWAFVPPKPKALTAALRSFRLCGHIVVFWTICFSETPPFLEVIAALTPLVAGISPCLSAKITFIIPPIPAAVSI